MVGHKMLHRQTFFESDFIYKIMFRFDMKEWAF